MLFWFVFSPFFFLFSFALCFFFFNLGVFLSCRSLGKWLEKFREFNHLISAPTQKWSLASAGGRFFFCVPPAQRVSRRVYEHVQISFWMMCREVSEAVRVLWFHEAALQRCKTLSRLGKDEASPSFSVLSSLVSRKRLIPSLHFCFQPYSCSLPHIFPTPLP